MKDKIAVMSLEYARIPLVIELAKKYFFGDMTLIWQEIERLKNVMAHNGKRRFFLWR